MSGVNNDCIAVKEQGDDIVFLRKIVKGGADKSYGIQVAKLAGVPDPVIRRAKELVEELASADITARAKEIAEMNTAAIYIVGAQEPGIARGMGLKTRVTFEEALEDAKRKFVGPNPNILALPKTFKVGAVHLCMKDDDLTTV